MAGLNKKIQVISDDTKSIDDENHAEFPPHLFYWLFYSCQLSLISVYYAFIYKLYFFTFVSLCVLLTSVNYWRKPMLGFRRYLDIITVQIAIYCALYKSQAAEVHCRNGYYVGK